ncbi:C-type lectin 37Db-like [Drosophila rhopaloa]|uniref:Accessory gland protein Acp29AB-like n=1 Tax=Drosophila rhopaloa TaxID=1041015 RepID=A0A6P4F2V6_DRORH|nr:C-type lectin 37Db-like [Drosophila rhopaloa]
MQYIFEVFLFSLGLQRSTATSLPNEQIEYQYCSSYICESVRMILQELVVLDKRIKRLEDCSYKFENLNKLWEEEREMADQFEDLTTKRVEMEAAIQKINVTVRDLAFKKIGSKFYYIEETEQRSWNDSRAFCLDLGGHLVSPQSQSELDALGKKLKKDENLYWTDIHDFSTEGVFISDTTGEKPKFINWRQEPDNWKNGEDCVEISNKWSMNDNDCSSRINFVCESQLL